MNRWLSMVGLFGLVTLANLTSAQAQSAEPSMGCRLFPLACPGPVPAPPPPLLGTPEEQAAVAAPPPSQPRSKHRKARKHHAVAPAQ